MIRTCFNSESYLAKGKWSFPCKTEKTAQEAKSIFSPVSSTPLNITHMQNTECIYFKRIMSKQFTPEVHSNLKFFQSKFTHAHTNQQRKTKMLTTDTVTLKSKAYEHIHTNKCTPTRPRLQESKLNSQLHTAGLFATLLLWDLINPDT